MHGELIADTRLDFIAYGHPTSNGTFGIGAVYLNQGSLEGRSESRTKTSDFSASDLAITMGAGKSMSSNTSLGANLRLIQSKVSGFSSTGFAMDVGVIWNMNSANSRLGFAVRNLGPKMKFLHENYNLPLNLAGGIGHQFAKVLLISADLKYQPHEARTSFGIGTEFSPVSLLSLRAGYLTNTLKPANTTNSSEKISHLNGLGIGLGLKIGPSTIDYFTSAGELGSDHRVSLSIRF